MHDAPSRWRDYVALAVLASAGCSGTGTTTPPTANPLGSTANILPYPSSLYERADPSSPTGIRLDLPSESIPLPASGEPFDPARMNARTGWPAATTILWAAPRGVDPSTLVASANFASSIRGESATVIVDMTTGDRVAHFAEVDANETTDFDRQAVYLRPAQRLASGHRYAVGIRNHVTARDGSPLPISEGFRAVLEDRDLGHARIDSARPRLREAVEALEAASIPRDSLLAAWDFTVADDASVIADPLAARDAALAAMGPLGANLSYQIVSDLGTLDNDPRIARRIEIDFQSPEVAPPGLTGYHRGADGRPTTNGTATAHAYVMVPPCATAQNKAGILIYGHGFFGGLDEPRNAEYLRDLGQEACLVVVATVWVGMSSDDTANALLALNDLNKAFGFGERIWQGIVNFIALEQLVRGKLATELLVDDQSQSIVDTSRVHYLGISQGHILGSTFFAYDPFISRAVLHVGAANWSLTFERSVNWVIYGTPLKGSYETLLDAVIMEQVLQVALEGVDGATIAGTEIPGTPPKHYLVQMSVGDAQVPNLASEFQARSLGLTLLTPSAALPFGVAQRQGPSSDRAFVIIDEHPTPMPPDTNVTFSRDNVAHQNPRRREVIQQMMREFWATGIARNTCNGPCDCAAGNCGPLRMPSHGGE